MRLPLQITFEGFPHSDAVEAAVRKKAEKQERQQAEQLLGALRERIGLAPVGISAR